jgi:hypothetical protein
MIKRNRLFPLINLFSKFALIVVFLPIICSTILAQNNTTSPYSLYGVGDLEPAGFGKIQALGGAGIALSSRGFLNNTNPASYNGNDSTASLFEIGIFGKKTKFSSQYQSRTDFSANFNYLAMGFKVYKWWGMSIGILPYSSVGYKIVTPETIDGSNTPYIIVREGSGGLTECYLSNSFKLSKNLSIGIKTSALFGPLTQTESYYINYSSSPAVLAENDFYLHRIYFDYGLQYRFHLKGLDYSIGAVFANNQYLKSKQTDKMYLSNGDTLVLNSQALQDFNIPGKLGLGVAVSKNNKLTAALDYTVQFWSANQPLGEAANLVNTHAINFGMEYAPSDYLHKEYLKIMSYRIGGYYKETYLELRGQQIKQYGAVVGLGFPINNLHSLINVSCEIGQRGDNTNGLIKENYMLVHIGFTLIESWFNRRKYD